MSIYPNITKKILLNALDFGSKYTSITDQDKEIIIHSCRTILYYDKSFWVKRNNADQFDIPMGSLHGAEACELVGLFLLDQMKTILKPDQFGLYRDDGLIVHDNIGVEIERTSKALRKLFNKNGFKISIESGLVTTEFLDVTLNLHLDSYRPYKKENSETVYIHKLSNHPEYIKRGIPNMINNRLNTLSKTKRDFEAVKANYQNALSKSEYKTELKFLGKDDNIATSKRKRRRKIIYFQPPFSKAVKTPLGRRFLRLVKKHFDPTHPLSKILNPKCLKISYSCLPNIKQEITSINRAIRGAAESTTTQEWCNCKGRKKDKTVCPMDGKCLKANIIYRADVMSNGVEKCYFGSTGSTFKVRYGLHKASLKHQKHGNPTALSTYIWEEREKGNTPEIKWSIVKEIKGKYSQKNGCPLCNREKLEIARSNKKKLLNKRNELKANCIHHRNNFFCTKD